MLYFLVLFISSIGHTQTFEQNFDCLQIDNLGLLKKSFDSFETDLFNHYKFDNDTIKTYRTFLSEVYSLSINLRKLPSSNSIELARVFKKNATDRNSLWVLLSQYDDEMEASRDASGPKENKQGGEAVMTFNYRGGFIQCLKNNSTSEGFKDIIETLEYDGNVSPSLIAQRLHDLPTEEFNTHEVKSFIAYDIYFSILLVIEKAFG
ncbi:hypothetical protein [Aquimarina sediminis]|uniref:hypothetical protein n=1 Tax=Aquimarina sediminis TaxID=2070536 RepID=UPI000FFF33AF|nr:hypothetical protein [Aquimarina sediminis]